MSELMNAVPQYGLNAAQAQTDKQRPADDMINHLIALLGRVYAHNTTIQGVLIRARGASNQSGEKGPSTPMPMSRKDLPEGYINALSILLERLDKETSLTSQLLSVVTDTL